MGVAVEVISGYATAPSTTYTAWTMNSSDSLTIRSFDVSKKAELLAQWGFNNGAGSTRVRSPRLHDNVRGIQSQVNATNPSPRFFPGYFAQPLYAQDTLIAEQTGAATAGNFEMGALLIHYDDIPGVAGRFITPAELKTNGLQAMGQYLALTPGSTGGYSGGVSVNNSADNWIANQDYALVGGVVDANCLLIGIHGVDSGNLRVAFPGYSASPQVTEDWFVRLSDKYELPLIPIFNSANKSAILVDAVQNQGGAAVNVTLYFVLLKPGTKTT